jgi:hypothetical protein
VINSEKQKWNNTAWIPGKCRGDAQTIDDWCCRSRWSYLQDCVAKSAVVVLRLATEEWRGFGESFVQSEQTLPFNN